MSETMPGTTERTDESVVKVRHSTMGHGEIRYLEPGDRLELRNDGPSATDIEVLEVDDA